MSNNIKVITATVKSTIVPAIIDWQQCHTLTKFKTYIIYLENENYTDGSDVSGVLYDRDLVGLVDGISLISLTFATILFCCCDGRVVT